MSLLLRETTYLCYADELSSVHFVLDFLPIPTGDYRRKNRINTQRER